VIETLVIETLGICLNRCCWSGAAWIRFILGSSI